MNSKHKWNTYWNLLSTINFLFKSFPNILFGICSENLVWQVWCINHLTKKTFLKAPKKDKLKFVCICQIICAPIGISDHHLSYRQKRQKRYIMTWVFLIILMKFVSGFLTWLIFSLSKLTAARFDATQLVGARPKYHPLVGRHWPSNCKWWRCRELG